MSKEILVVNNFINDEKILNNRAKNLVKERIAYETNKQFYRVYCVKKGYLLVEKEKYERNPAAYPGKAILVTHKKIKRHYSKV